MKDISRRDMFKGLLVVTTATALAKLGPDQAALVVRASQEEIQAFGRIMEPTPVSVARTLMDTRSAIGELVFISRDGEFRPIGVIRSMDFRNEPVDLTQPGDMFRRMGPGLISLSYEVVAMGAAHVKAAEHVIR
jgi:hypothetical protein